jgi:putative transposase
MDASLQARAEQLATEFAGEARTAEDLNGLMRLMMKSVLERMLNTELDVHLGRKGLPASASDESPDEPPNKPGKRPPNRRNGHSPKTVQGEMGELTIDTPRDRAGTFEPQLIAKHQRRVPGFDEKILALYAKGMTTRDIQDIVASCTAWKCRPRSSLKSRPISIRKSPPGERGCSPVSGRSCTSTASWCMSDPPAAASRNTRFTWL